MRRLALSMLIGFIGVMWFVGGMITPVKAANFEPWTNNGVSQYLAGNLNQDSFPLKLFNPNKMTHVAAIIAYNRVQIEVPGDEEEAEVFLGCFVFSLTPHGAYSIDEELMAGNNTRGYAEVISVPERKKNIFDHFSSTYNFNNDYGINGNRAGPASIVLLDPKFFTAPPEAKDCVCDQLDERELDPKTFKAFKIQCKKNNNR